MNTTITRPALQDLLQGMATDVGRAQVIYRLSGRVDCLTLEDADWAIGILEQAGQLSEAGNLARMTNQSGRADDLHARSSALPVVRDYRIACAARWLGLSGIAIKYFQRANVPEGAVYTSMQAGDLERAMLLAEHSGKFALACYNARHAGQPKQEKVYAALDRLTSARLH